MRIPEDILNKEGPLTADEWQIIKSHATEGADLLKRIQLVDQMPMIVAFEHHQRHDLQGYPEPQAATEQHLFSKVVALCDAYDAMTTSRPFRREIRPDKALAVLMQGRGKAYDPSLTKAFVAMLGIYPDGRGRAAGRRLDRRRVPREPRRPAAPAREGAHRRRRAAGSTSPQVVDLRLVDPRPATCACSIDECIPAAEAGIDDVWEYL